jgi:hypothetical protein
VRQRMRLKMDMLNDLAVDQFSPSDGELDSYLKSHGDEFRTEPAASFEQIFLSPDRRGASLAPDAATLLAQLRAGAVTDVSNAGDVTQLPEMMKLTPRSAIAHDFGEEFTAAIMSLPTGSWTGPIASGYGMHLIRVSERRDGQSPPLADVRDAVAREWKNDKRKELEERRLAEFTRHYDIVVTHGTEPGR